MSQLEPNEPMQPAPEPQPPQEAQLVPEIVVHEVRQPAEPHNTIDEEGKQAERASGSEEAKEIHAMENEQNGPSEADMQEEEEEEEQDKKDKEPEDKGRSPRKEESSESNNGDNDTSNLQVAGGKKCFNKLCNSKKIYKKIRSKVETQRYRFLCKNCYDNYLENFFCDFCEQIYSNYQNEEDDTKWIGCDKCERWNHLQCERKFRNKNFEISKDKDTQYECLTCSKKHKNGNAPAADHSTEVKRKPLERDSGYEGIKNYKTPKAEIDKDERVPIFHKKPESFPCLESFLQTYNFRLWLNDTHIREDIQALRNHSRRPALDEEPKKVKKIKLDY